MPCATSRPGEARHLDVEEGEVGLEGGDPLRRLDAVAGDGDDRQRRPRLFQQLAQVGGEVRLVVGDERGGRRAHDATGSDRRAQHAARLGGADVERGARAVGLLEAAPDVGERGTAAGASGRGMRGVAEAGAVVVDGDDERAAVAARADANAPAGDLRLEAVDDRVLDQRLQRQRRQGQGAQRRRHLDRVVEPVFHADLDDPHVGVDQVDLVAERVPAVAEARRAKRAGSRRTPRASTSRAARRPPSARRRWRAC